MWILERDLRHFRSLSPVERELLSGYVTGDLSGRDTETAASLLRAIRRDQRWLGCDCVKPMPVLHIALRESGRLSLRNNPETGRHAAGCVFAHENILLPRSAGPEMAAGAFTFLKRSNFEICSSLAREVTQISRSAASGAQAAGASSKPLLSLLLTFLETANLNVWSPANSLGIADQYQQLREAASRFTLPPAVPLTDFFDTRINMQWLVAMATKLRATDRFKDRAKIALLVDTVTSVKGRAIQTSDGKEFSFHGHLERFGRLNSPSIAVGTVAKLAENGLFELVNVAAVPVMSRSELFPLYDECERDPLRDIAGLLKWLYEKKDLKVSMRRELFMACAPSTVELRSRSTVIQIDVCTQVIQPAPKVALPNSSIERLYLHDFPDITMMKKVIASRFIGGHRA